MIAFISLSVESDVKAIILLEKILELADSDLIVQQSN